jgi:hypothetical protein
VFIFRVKKFATALGLLDIEDEGTTFGNYVAVDTA